jgi:flagellar secretion chaperone FliS
VDREHVTPQGGFGNGGFGSRHRSPASRYQQIDLASRIESATPHSLVTMLYTELCIALAVMRRAAAAGDQARQREQHERASSILHTLEASLDRAQGGALADTLAGIYRQMRRRLLAGRSGDMAAIDEVVAGIESLATAWARIAV